MLNELETENELETVQEDNEEKYFLVLQTEVYYDEIRHEISSIWSDKKKALKEAEKRIKEMTENKYTKMNDSFYGGVDDIVYIISVSEKTIECDNTPSTTQII